MRIDNNYALSAIAYGSEVPQKVVGDADKSFSDIVEQKTSAVDKQYWRDRASKAFDTMGPNTPSEVKQAWMETVEETGMNVGFYYDGETLHYPPIQLLNQRILRGVKGEPDDLFGNSVQSTMRVIQTAIYDIDHPLSGGTAKSITEQQEARKERAFYVAFLEKLKRLSDQGAFESKEKGKLSFSKIL